MTKSIPKPELLAPAGNVESFFAAVENGADAVYLGLKRFNARETASNFTMEDLSTMVPFAQKRGVRVYIALNSQIATGEISELLDALNFLSSLKPDSLIVQDPGLFYIVRRWFLDFKLHASTLAAVHNSSGVRTLHAAGADRVVLARELSLNEIGKISSTTEAELEVFIHGALCYSYSGLCLASSFRGGRSGLRGQCVQPCRLKFRQGNKEGFFLSCNDLCALPVIPKLKRMRIAALKIEGRMKPAAWVADVVKAYRSVLDADTADLEKTALATAQELLSQTPSRRLSSGYLDEKDSGKILSPHRSGSIGIWSATVKSITGGRALIDLRRPVSKGDRLRPESSAGREEEAFTVSQLYSVSGNSISSAEAGCQAYLSCSKPLHAGDRLFRVGTKSEPVAAIWRKIREEASPIQGLRSKFSRKQKVLDEIESPVDDHAQQKESLILKIDSLNDLVPALQSQAAMVFLSATRNNLERIAKQRFSPAQMKKVGFSLPVLIHEKELDYFRAAVGWFIEKGFSLWEINNWGHFDLLKKGREGRLSLISGSRLNLRNSAAFAQTAEMGCRMSVLSLEITREELQELAQNKVAGSLVVSLYCWPPLFISRLIPDLYKERPFLSGRNEAYYMTARSGHAEIYADRPMSWLEQLPYLRSLGFRNFLIDIASPPGKNLLLSDALKGFSASRSPGRNYSLFNFERRR